MQDEHKDIDTVLNMRATPPQAPADLADRIIAQALGEKQNTLPSFLQDMWQGIWVYRKPAMVMASVFLLIVGVTFFIETPTSNTITPVASASYDDSYDLATLVVYDTLLDF